jgi:hypothetical protein
MFLRDVTWLQHYVRAMFAIEVWNKQSLALYQAMQVLLEFYHDGLNCCPSATTHSPYVITGLITTTRGADNKPLQTS